MESTDLDPRAVENGDTFDEDTGAYLGQVELENSSSFPVQISIFQDGAYFVYKLDSKQLVSTTEH